jgi:hypothetical protein
MSICTACGSILNENDSGKHKCKAANIPISGKEKEPTTTEAVIVG